MKLTELELEYQLNSKSEKGIPVIIAAAGASSRMCGTNKQFALLCGIPVLARTMLNFQRLDEVSRIIVATGAEFIKDVQYLGKKFMIDKLSDVVVGGETRAKTIKNAISYLSSDEKYVLIHDGARPLTDEQTILNVINQLEKSCAVSCGVPVKDTLKRIKDNVVLQTLPRDELIAIQTPQGVEVEKYREALASVDNLSNFTDDLSIMENAGYKCEVVMGSYKNIKITTPEDLIIARAFIEEETKE